MCALFRLCRFKQIPRSLRELLEDESIIKVGVAPRDDAQKLHHDYGVRVAGTFDLRFLASAVGRKPGSLAKMSKEILNIELDKDWSLITSDWDAEHLSEKELLYAANDVLVAVEIFKKLHKDLKSHNLDDDFILNRLDTSY